MDNTDSLKWLLPLNHKRSHDTEPLFYLIRFPKPNIRFYYPIYGYKHLSATVTVCVSMSLCLPSYNRCVVELFP